MHKTGTTAKLFWQMVTVQTSSATRDLMLIQQNKFCWISNRSWVEELVCTVTWRIFGKENLASNMANGAGFGSINVK